MPSPLKANYFANSLHQLRLRRVSVRGRDSGLHVAVWPMRYRMFRIVEASNIAVGKRGKRHAQDTNRNTKPNQSCSTSTLKRYWQRLPFRPGSYPSSRGHPTQSPPPPTAGGGGGGSAHPGDRHHRRSNPGFARSRSANYRGSDASPFRQARRVRRRRPRRVAASAGLLAGRARRFLRLGSLRRQRSELRDRGRRRGGSGVFRIGLWIGWERRDHRGSGLGRGGASRPGEPPADGSRNRGARERICRSLRARNPCGRHHRGRWCRQQRCEIGSQVQWNRSQGAHHLGPGAGWKWGRAGQRCPRGYRLGPYPQGGVRNSHP